MSIRTPNLRQTLTRSMRFHYFNYVPQLIIIYYILIIRTSSDTQKITSTASPSEKEQQLSTETEESNVSSWSARAAQCELQSTSHVLKLLSESDCSAFHKWYFSVDNKRSFEIVSNLEPNGNYEIYNCYGTTQSMGKETSRTYYRCANPNAPSCSWVTSVNRAMSRHQNTTTHSPGIGDVFCPYCKKYYSRPDSLKRHLDKLGCKEGPKPLEAPDGGNK